MIRATSLGRRQAPTRWCGALLIAPLIATLVSAAVSAALGAVRHPALGRVVMLGPPNQGSEVVDRFGKMPGFDAINGPAGAQLGTGPDSIPSALGPVSYPVGVIAGTKSINWILSTALPNPDDGKVSVARTRVEGMADFISVAASHPLLVRDADAIRQTLAFLEDGKFVHDAAPAAPPSGGALTAR